MKTFGFDTHRPRNVEKYQPVTRDPSSFYQHRKMSYGSNLWNQKLEKITPSTHKIASNKYQHEAYKSPNKVNESKYEKSSNYAEGQRGMRNKNVISAEKELYTDFNLYSSQKVESDHHRKSKRENGTNLERSGLTDPQSLFSSNVSQQKQNRRKIERADAKYQNCIQRGSIPSTKSINGSEIDKDLDFNEDRYCASIHNDQLTKSSYQETLKYKKSDERNKQLQQQHKGIKEKTKVDYYFNKISSNRLEQERRLLYSKIDNIQTDRVHYETGFLKKNEDQIRSRNPTHIPFDFQLKKNINNSLKAIPRLDKMDNLKYDISTLSTRHPSIYTPAEKKISIKDFKFGKCLGHGRFGKVFQAIEKKTGFLVALKKISKETIKVNKLEDQMALEIKIQMYLSHPNIVKLYGIINETDDIYLILEHLEEGSLYGYLKNRGKLLSQKQVSLIVKETVSAIKYLHDLNVVHRDLKPQNILISNNVCKLGDFGWATLCNERRKTNCGTLDYYAPQILQGRQYDESIDLWCVGVLTFELLTGKVPFYHANRKQTMKKIKKVQRMDFPLNTSHAAKGFVEALLVKQPTKRMNVNSLLIHPFITKYFEQKL